MIKKLDHLTTNDIVLSEAKVGTIFLVYLSTHASELFFESHFQGTPQL
jgi:hypothetical protein